MYEPNENLYSNIIVNTTIQLQTQSKVMYTHKLKTNHSNII
jgi:hypothetical protein